MLVKRYRNRVVQKMRRIGRHIELIFPSAEVGQPRERITITQRDWNQHGSESYEDGKSIRDFRTAASDHAA